MSPDNRDGAASRSSALAGSTRGAVLILLATASCVDVRDHGGRPRREVAVWELPPESREHVVQLVPGHAGGPQRMKRAMETSERADRLDAVVNGRDPAFSWQLARETPENVVTIDVDSDFAGILQVFWASAACPNYTEACSAVWPLAVGSNVFSFPLDDRQPLRALRVDPPDHAGARLSFRRILVGRDGAFESRWSALPTVPRLELNERGLSLVDTNADPGITVATPGLVAERVTAVELVLRGPSDSAPQLFWTGACANFSEACSVILQKADAGALTHRAAVARHPRWKGKIENLRLDPGQGAGTYTIERIALVNDTPE